jgi:predicted glycosyltransferase
MADQAPSGGPAIEEDDIKAEHKADGLSLLAYTPDGLGIGHLRRNTNIAVRFAKETSSSNAVVIGAWPSVVPVRGAPGVDFIKLASLHKTPSQTWRSRSLRLGLRTLLDVRSSMIISALEGFNPDVFLVDHTPAGRCGELQSVLAFLKDNQPKTKIVLGMRDIQERPDVIRAAWKREGVYDLIERYYDLILIYGEQAIFDAAGEYGLNSLKRPIIKYCGYVGPDDLKHRPGCITDEPGTEVGRRLLIMGGGGSVAFRMMNLCIEAIALLCRRYDLECTLITGPLMDCQERRSLEERAAAIPVAVIPYVDNPIEYIRAADLVIGMAGYNTVVEAAALRKRMIAIPWNGPRSEQSLRASIFAERGYITTRQLEGTTPESLSETVSHCLEIPGPPEVNLDLNGLATVVTELRKAAQSPGLG